MILAVVNEMIRAVIDLFGTEFLCRRRNKLNPTNEVSVWSLVPGCLCGTQEHRSSMAWQMDGMAWHRCNDGVTHIWLFGWATEGGERRKPTPPPPGGGAVGGQVITQTKVKGGGVPPPWIRGRIHGGQKKGSKMLSFRIL